MSKLLKTVAIIAGVTALAFTGVGLAAGMGAFATSFGIGVSASTLFLASAGLSVASSLLAKRPKAPQTSASNADRLQANIDPRTPRKIIFGKTAMATDIRDQEFDDGQNYLHRFIVVASHKCQSAADEIWFDDKLAWTAAGGAQGEFAGYLDVTVRNEGNAGNAINISTRMGNQRRYTGLAYVYFRYKLKGNDKKVDSPFAQAIPTRVTIIGKGAWIYDPRLDSTVPGGSGAMRAGDQSTWAWSDNGSRNTALQLLWYLLGWRINGKLAVGKGIPAKRVDLESFITAANMCDEAVGKSSGGTEPRYRTDGIFSEADSPGLVLDALKSSMNAILDDVDGRLRLLVLHNDLATPIADLDESDIIGDYTWEQTATLDETFNIVRGSFTDPSTKSLYQMIDYPEVAIESPDSIDRIETIDLPLVQSPSQAQRLAKQRLARMLYSGTFAATFSHRAWKLQRGDPMRLSFSPLGWTNRLFRVVDTGVRVDGTVPMLLRIENSDIYLWDNSDQAAVQPVDPTTYDPYKSPLYQDVSNPTYSDGTSIDDLRPATPGADATGGATAYDTLHVGGVPAEDVLAAFSDALAYGPDIDAIKAQIADVFANFVPATFDEDGLYWTAGNAGAPEDAVPIVADSHYSFPDISDIGKVGQIVVDAANTRRFNSIGIKRCVAGRKYRVTARVRHTGTGGTPNIDVKILALDINHAVVLAASISQNFNTTASFADYVVMLDGTTAVAAGAMWLRASVEGEVVGKTYQVQVIEFDDVTESEGARGYAGEAESHAAAADASAAAAQNSYELIAEMPSRPNLLPNSSGENGTFGWSFFNITGIDRFANGWGPHIYAAGWSGAYAVIISPRAPVFAGQPYTFSGEIESFGTPGPATTTMQAVFFNSAGAQVGYQDGPSLAGNRGYSNDGSNRRARAFQATAPASATSVEIRCYVTYANPSDITNFSCRQLKIEQGDMPATLYNNVAQVTQTAGAVSTAAGKLAAYWQVTAVAGGRAQLTVYADANGGAGVDVVGDFRVSGSALIVGTLVANRFVTDQGVDLAAIVPGSTNTGVTGSSSGATVAYRKTSPSDPPNYAVPFYTPVLPAVSSGALCFINWGGTFSGLNGATDIFLQWSPDYTNWYTLQSSKITTFLTAGTYNYLYQQFGLTSDAVYRIVLQNNSSNSAGNGVDISITNPYIDVTRVFKK